MENYKEVKNYLHNELRLTKKEVKEIIANEVHKEVKKYLGKDNSKMVYDAVKEIIKSEVISTVEGTGFPQVVGNMFNYGRNEEYRLKDYITGTIKNEIMDTVEKQFDIKFDIQKKQKEDQAS